MKAVFRNVVVKRFDCQLEMVSSHTEHAEIIHKGDNSQLSQKQILDDSILKGYPQEIKSLTERVDGYRANAKTVVRYPSSKEAFLLIISGTLQVVKTETGKTILEACKAMSSPDHVTMRGY